MKFPKKIKMFGRTYEIIRAPELNEEGTMLGCVSYEKQIIALKKRSDGFKEEMEAEVLLHELIHAVDHHMDVGLSEAKVKRLAMGLFTVLRDNKINFGDID